MSLNHFFLKALGFGLLISLNVWNICNEIEIVLISSKCIIQGMVEESVWLYLFSNLSLISSRSSIK